MLHKIHTASFSPLSKLELTLLACFTNQKTEVLKLHQLSSVPKLVNGRD
jgi:hypothetical protein